MDMKFLVFIWVIITILLLILSFLTAKRWLLKNWLSLIFLVIVSSTITLNLIENLEKKGGDIYCLL